MQHHKSMVCVEELVEAWVDTSVITPVSALEPKPAKPVRVNRNGKPSKKRKKGKPKIPKNEGYVSSYKFRLDQSPSQERLLKSYCGTVRAVYNTVLYHARARYDQRDAQISYGIPEAQLTELIPLTLVDLQNFVQDQKENWFPWHVEVSKFAFDTAVRNLVKAYQNFFAGRTKYPKFKKKPIHDLTADLSISMVDVKAKWLTPNGSHINLPIAKGLWPEMRSGRRKLVGSVKVADKRARRAAELIHSGQATVQEVTFSYSGGYWWASVRLRVRKKSLRQKVRRTKDYIGGVCGIDASFGQDFAVLSCVIPGITDDEGRIDAPKVLRKKQAKLTKTQRVLNRTKNGSQRNKKALKKVQKLHGQVVAERKRWLSELATDLVGRFDKIVVEDLNLAALAKRKKDKRGRKVFSFGKSVNDNAYGMFCKMLEEKSKLFGVVFVRASRWFASSKTCSDCGEVKAKLPLPVRVFKCTNCGLIIDRDVNAARNLEQYVPGQAKRAVLGNGSEEIKELEAKRSESATAQNLSSEVSIGKTSQDQGSTMPIPADEFVSEGSCTVCSDHRNGVCEPTRPRSSKAVPGLEIIQD